MEATRVKPTPTKSEPASAPHSSQPARVAAPVIQTLPLYAGPPAVRLSSGAAGPTQTGAPADVPQVVSAPGSGAPLTPQVQASLESSLGADMSSVRVHTGGEASAAAQTLGARAFTHGSNIFLGAGERPTDVGLMAHEATHVIQQRAAPAVQMSSATTAPDSLEQEARQASAAVQQGGQVTVTGRTEASQVQKQEENVPLWKRAGRAIGRGATAVGSAVVKGAEAALEWGEEVGWSLLNKYAPDLVPIIHQGIGEWLKEKISSAIETVFNTLMAPVRAVTGVVQSLSAHFSELLTWMREAAAQIARGDCSVITQAVEKIQKVIEGIASPIIDRVKQLAKKVGDFFTGLWERFGAPVWDFLKRVGGWVWDKIQQLGSWIWDKTAPIRNLLSRAWKWIKDKLGVGEGPEGQNGLLQWVQKKAAAAWDWIKAKIEPIKKPLMVVGAVLVMLSPAGPIIAIGAAIGGIIMGIRWIRQHLNTPDGVVKNRGVLQGVIIPGIMNAVKGFTGKLASIATSITDKLNKVMGGLGDLVGAVGGSILRFAVSAVKWIADQFQGLVQWAGEKLNGLVNWITNGLERLRVFLQPVLDVLAKVGEVIGDILQLPGLILGKVWKAIPACIRDPFVDFLTNQILKRLPFFNQLLEIADIWSKIKTGALTAIKQIFKNGDLKGAMVTVFKTLLDVLNVPLQLVVAIFSKAGSVLDLIVANPKVFLINVLLAIKEGFVNFFNNILKHLINGVIGWLTSELKEANIHVEGSLTDFWSIFKLVLQIVGLSIERVFELLGEKIGKDKVEKLKSMFKVLSGIWDWVTAVMTEGLAGLWKKVKEQLTNLYDLLLDSVIGWVTDTIIGEVIKQLLSMLDPTGIMAVVKSIIAVYKAVQSFKRYLTQMLQIINTILDSLVGLAKGDISPAAVLLENAMDKAMPVVIGFLANQIGLGGIGKRIQEIIKKVREKVASAINWLLDKAINTGKAVLNSLGVGGAKPDERTPEQKRTAEIKGDQLSIPLILAGAGHTLSVKVPQGKVEIWMASNEEKIRARYGQVLKIVESYKKYIDKDVEDVEVKKEFEKDIAPYIELMIDEQIDIRTKQLEGKTSKDKMQLLEDARSDAQKLVQEISKWAQSKGLKDLAADAVKEQLNKKIDPEWEKRWRARQQEVQEALENFVPRIKELDPKAELKYRGSLSKGKKYHEKRDAEGRRLAFNPDEFDVDAFIQSDELVRQALENGAKIIGNYIYGSKSNVSSIMRLISEMRKALSKINEKAGKTVLKLDGFDVYLRTDRQVKDLLRQPEEEHKRIEAPATGRRTS